MPTNEANTPITADRSIENIEQQESSREQRQDHGDQEIRQLPSQNQRHPDELWKELYLHLISKLSKFKHHILYNNESNK